MPAGIFRMFPVAAGRAGGTFVEVPTRPGHRPDIEAMKRRIGPGDEGRRDRQPEQPDGRLRDRGGPRPVLRRPPGARPHGRRRGLLRVRVRDAGLPDALDYVRAGHNVVVLRTFSKIYGLAGLRIGYAFAPPEIAAAMNKVREPFNTTSVAPGGRDRRPRGRRALRADEARSSARSGAFLADGALAPGRGREPVARELPPRGAAGPVRAPRGRSSRAGASSSGRWGGGASRSPSGSPSGRTPRTSGSSRSSTSSSRRGCWASPPSPSRPPDDRRRHRRPLGRGEVDGGEGPRRAGSGVPYLDTGRDVPGRRPPRPAARRPAPDPGPRRGSATSPRAAEVRVTGSGAGRPDDPGRGGRLGGDPAAGDLALRLGGGGDPAGPAAARGAAARDGALGRRRPRGAGHRDEGRPRGDREVLPDGPAGGPGREARSRSSPRKGTPQDLGVRPGGDGRAGLRGLHAGRLAR